jgi:hypothetical protein
MLPVVYVGLLPLRENLDLRYLRTKYRGGYFDEEIRRINKRESVAQ